MVCSKSCDNNQNPENRRRKPVQLEEYFEFEKFDSPFGPFERIRIKGHRIAIENVLEFYQQALSPEEIVQIHYPSLSLEQVYATITYYLQNKQAVDAYIERGEQVADGFYQEWQRKHKPSALEEKLRRLRSAGPSAQQESA
jgi:uncharacterized protein (DUF433 family)